MSDGPSSTAGVRGVLSWALLLLAAAMLVAAVVASWARGVLFDRDGFRATVAAVLEPQATRRAIVDLTLEAAFQEDPALAEAAYAALAEPLTEVLGSEEFASLLDGAAGLAFDVLVTRGEEDIRLDATAIRDSALALAVPADEPTWIATLRATPTPFLITLVEAKDLPSLAPHDEGTRPLPFLLLGAAFVLAVLGVRVAVDRGAAAGRFVLLATLLAALVAVLTWWAPGWLATGALRPAGRVLVTGAGHVLLGSLRARLVVVVVAGGLMLLLRWRVLANFRGAAE